MKLEKKTPELVRVCRGAVGLCDKLCEARPTAIVQMPQ